MGTRKGGTGDVEVQHRVMHACVHDRGDVCHCKIVPAAARPKRPGSFFHRVMPCRIVCTTAGASESRAAAACTWNMSGCTNFLACGPLAPLQDSTHPTETSPEFALGAA